MKINPRINKQVNESVAECRQCIVNATIELLKKLGATHGQTVALRKVLFVHQFKYGRSETRPADTIWYFDNNGRRFCTCFGDDYYASSDVLTIDNLLLVYNEVKRLVREE